MKIKNYLVPILLMLALLVIGAWLATSTEWVNTQVPTPAKGEARENPYYVVQHLLRALGGTVVARDGLDRLPPPHGRLILADGNWDVLPGRQQRLQTWVAQGGHLIIPSEFLDQKGTKDWLPMTWEKEKDAPSHHADDGGNGSDDASDSDGHAASGAPASQPAGASSDKPANATSDASADEPADAASDASADEPADAASNASADEPADTASNTSANEPAGAASDASADEPADATSNASADEPADAASNASANELANAASNASSAKPANAASGAASAKPADATPGASATKPASAPVAKPAPTPAQAASQTSAQHPESATDEAQNADCHPVEEPQDTPAWYPGHRNYVACFGTRPPHVVPRGEDKPLWQVVGTDDSDETSATDDANKENKTNKANEPNATDGANSAASPRGAEIIRMRYGQGTITVIDGWSLMRLDDDRALPGDNALLIAAALQAQRGATFWFVTEASSAGHSKDAGLLAWLWQRGGVALGLALLTLALVIWRSAVRFGPLARAASIERRSMAEQVRGTGRFLRARGGAALHAAQLRALHEAAAPRLFRYATLDTGARATAIAAATGLDPAALARAMQTPPRKPAELAFDLELLETARRRLLAGTIATTSAATATGANRASSPASDPTPDPASSTPSSS